MNPILKITKIPLFNSVVIRQEGGRFFISAPNSIVIGKENLLLLLEGLLRFEFIDRSDLKELLYETDDTTSYGKDEHENKESNDSSNIRQGDGGENYGSGDTAKEVRTDL